MKKVAILTMDSLDDFYAYDELLEQPLAQKGWKTDYVSWRDDKCDWNAFDVVLVRSPWDYQQDVEAFIACLAKIEKSRAFLENPFSLMTWNIRKTYLRDLEDNGVLIVPTLWYPTYHQGLLTNAFDILQTNELIIKPVVSANADFTYRIQANQFESIEARLVNEFSNRELMLQPFLPSILCPGEYSLFYFDHQFSHAILKTPAQGDFRVQEEHGGQLTTIQPTPEMLSAADKTLAALPEKSLYARIDLIELNNDFAVMEVELIEPSLYFNMDKQSAQRFVDAFVKRFGDGNA